MYMQSECTCIYIHTCKYIYTYIRSKTKCVNFCCVNFFAHIWQERSIGLCRLVVGNGASGGGGAVGAHVPGFMFCVPCFAKCRRRPTAAASGAEGGGLELEEQRGSKGGARRKQGKVRGCFPGRLGPSGPPAGWPGRPGPAGRPCRPARPARP